VCAVAAVAAFASLTVAGRPRAGAALAAGLLLGSLNGFLARKSLGLDASFRATSLGRLALLSLAGLAIGWPLGLENVPLVLVGLGAAQLLLAGLAVKAAFEASKT
jgi:hypothetical protein